MLAASKAGRAAARLLYLGRCPDCREQLVMCEGCGIPVHICHQVRRQIERPGRGPFVCPDCSHADEASAATWLRN